MKKGFLFLSLFFFFGCSHSVDYDVDFNNQIFNGEEPGNRKVSIIIVTDNKEATGYVTGGIINNQFVSLQNKDSYKLFSLTGSEKYYIISQNNKKQWLDGNYSVAQMGATGTTEIKVTFEEAEYKLNPNTNYFGISGIPEEEFENIEFFADTGDYLIDFDNDGNKEIVRINQLGTKSKEVSIIFENVQGENELAKFELDGIYITNFILFALDLDGDGKKEIIIAQYGHDYFLEVFKGSTNSCEKLISYSLSN